jgi:hypothetical protein
MDSGVLLFSARKAAHMYLVASSTSSRILGLLGERGALVLSGDADVTQLIYVS